MSGLGEGKRKMENATKSHVFLLDGVDGLRPS